MANQQNKVEKSVSFASSGSMRRAKHLNDYTEEEFNATYYSSVEYREFKRDVKCTLRMIETKQKMDDISYCSRGVECLTKQSMAVRTKLRNAARFAVLDKEFHQFLRVETGETEDIAPTDEDERIAIVYSGVTRESATNAYNKGLSDERSVLTYNFGNRLQDDGKEPLPLLFQDADIQLKCVSSPRSTYGTRRQELLTPTNRTRRNFCIHREAVPYQLVDTTIRLL